jgi:hypothetical protein
MPLSVIDDRLVHTGTLSSKEHSSKSGLVSAGGQSHLQRHPFPKLSESSAAADTAAYTSPASSPGEPAIQTTSPAA